MPTLRPCIPWPTPPPPHPPPLSRTITTTSWLHKKSSQLPPRPTLPDDELQHTFLKGSGPGGQKINKTNSAVQMTHLPTGIVVKSQATRSKSQNYTIARKILAERIEYMEKGSESRMAKKEERVRTRKASSSKKSNRKYRKLAEGKEGVVGEGNEGRENEDGGLMEGGEDEEGVLSNGKEKNAILPKP